MEALEWHLPARRLQLVQFLSPQVTVGLPPGEEVEAKAHGAAEVRTEAKATGPVARGKAEAAGRAAALGREQVYYHTSGKDAFVAALLDAHDVAWLGDFSSIFLVAPGS